MLIIDDGNFQQHLAPPVIDGVQMSTGRSERDYDKMPLGFCAAAPVSAIKPYPRSEWSARIKEKKERQETVSGIRRQKKLKSLNQNGTNYCWSNAVVNLARLTRALNNQPEIDLSPASVAAPIRNYANQGGLGIEAIDYISRHGIAPTSLWPANAIDRRYDNAESRAARKKFIFTEWTEPVAQNDGQNASQRLAVAITLALMGIPMALGYAWWGHEVVGMDAVEVEANSFGLLIWNSWDDSWGDQGEGILRGDKAIPMDIVCGRVMHAAAA